MTEFRYVNNVPEEDLDCLLELKINNKESIKEDFYNECKE